MADDADGRTDKRFVSSIPKSCPYIVLIVSWGGGGDSKMLSHAILGGLVQKSLMGELFEKSRGDQEQRWRTEYLPEGRCLRASTGSWSMLNGRQRKTESYNIYQIGILGLAHINNI